MSRFRQFTWSLGLIATFCLASCATAPPSPQVRQAAVRVALIDGMPLPPARTIREVQATSCAVVIGEQPVIANARDKLRVEAARVGANAVGNIMCDIELARGHSECWEIARCTGDATCASRSSNPQVAERCD